MITVKDGDSELEFTSMAEALDYMLKAHYSRRANRE